MSFKLILDMHESLEETGITDEYIEALEEFITECNEAEARGEELVDDSVYDTVKTWLQDVSPDSDVLKHVWSTDVSDLTDLDIYQQKFPMVSIQTIKDINDKEVNDFISKMTGSMRFLASMKLNGHGIRVVFNNGVLVKAHTRGRSSNGRDITRQAKNFIGDKPELDGFGLVEVRGEVLIPFENLSAAKQFNPAIKSAFSGVSSLIKESSTKEENELLRFVAYNVFFDGSEEFVALSDKFNFLDEHGFETPYGQTFTVGPSKAKMAFEKIVEMFATVQETYSYYTDGVVVSVDLFDEFESFGSEEHHHNGNLALKIGFWKQDMYSAVIEDIKWKRGKNKLSPVAVVEPTLTVTGNTVRHVPLYNPYNILILDAYPGEVIHFRYGGEAGVKPCFADGRNVTEI